MEMEAFSLDDRVVPDLMNMTSMVHIIMKNVTNSAVSRYYWITMAKLLK